MTLCQLKTSFKIIKDTFLQGKCPKTCPSADGFRTFLEFDWISIKDFQKISPEVLLFDEGNFQQQLLPVLRNTKKQVGSHAWKAAKLQECKRNLEKLLPFAEHEKEFLKNLNEKGKILAMLLTNDTLIQSKIENLPLLRWKASLIESNKQ